MDEAKTITETEWLNKMIGTAEVPKNGLKVILKSCGNPDHQQYAPISDPETVFGSSIKDCVAAAMKYRDYWDMGGGNWLQPKIWFVWLDKVKDKVRKKAIAEISYNGRVWIPNKKWDDRTEIV